MAQRASRFRVLTTVVHLPALSELYLGQMARAFRTALNDPESATAMNFRHPPGGGAPCFPFAGPQWRVYAGGALVSTSTFMSQHGITVEGLPPGKPRVVLPFEGEDARRALALDLDQKTWWRRTAWLYQTQDGNWVFRMRWERRPKVRK